MAQLAKVAGHEVSISPKSIASLRWKPDTSRSARFTVTGPVHSGPQSRNCVNIPTSDKRISVSARTPANTRIVSHR